MSTAAASDSGSEMGDAQAARDVVRIPTVMGGDARSEERGRGTGELVGWQMQVGRLKVADST